MNFTFTAPEGRDDVSTLRCYKDDRKIVSCWKASWKERFKFLFFGKVWMYTEGQSFPPTSLVIDRTVFQQEK